MSSGLLIALEMAGVLLVAVGWGVYELWKLRQWRERERRSRADTEGGGGDEPPR
jgi:hypothetical protein